LLDHVIVLNERHLKRLMTEYVRYYHDDRTHLALEKGTPAGREALRGSDAACRVVVHAENRWPAPSLRPRRLSFRCDVFQ
jgi:hypothetical protein